MSQSRSVGQRWNLVYRFKAAVRLIKEISKTAEVTRKHYIDYIIITYISEDLPVQPNADRPFVG